MAGLRIGDPASFIGDGYVGDPPDYAGFPVIVSQNKGADAVGSPYSVALPPGFQTGDRLFVLIKSETVDNEYTFPARWTKVFRKWEATLTVDVNLALYELIVDGSADASETSPITVSIASGGVATWLTFCVRGAHASAASEAGVATFSNASTTPDPPNLAPSWGTEKTLWIAVEGGSSGGTFTTAFPLPNFNERSNDASGGRVSAASIRDEVSSKNPGAFTLDSSVRWIANTVAVRPAAAAADDRIGQQCVGEVSPFEQEMGVEQGVQSAPLEDTAAADDDVTDAWIGDPEEFEAFDIASFMQARAPPAGEEEDIVPSSVVSDAFGESETTDGGIQAGPPDQDEEDILGASVADLAGDLAPDEDDISVTASPLEDEEVVDASILGAHIGDSLDAESDAHADALLAPPDQDEEDILGVSVGDFASEESAQDDLTVVSAPLDDLAAADGDIVAASVSEPAAFDVGLDAGEQRAPLEDESFCVFPTLVDVTTSVEDTPTLSHTIALPSGIAAGQLLVAVLGANRVVDNDSTWPAGWTEVFDEGFSGGSGSAGLSVGYRVADGTEGASIEVVRTVLTQSANACLRFDGAHAVSVPEVSAPGSEGDSATPDSGSLSPSWGSDRTFWITAFNVAASPAVTISAYPTNYNTAQTYVASAGAGFPSILGLAARLLEAGTEDPGAFTISATDTWVAATIAIRGSCAPDTQVGAASIGDAAATPDLPEDSVLGSPLQDFPADDERVSSSADGPEDFPTPFDGGLAAWPLADEEPVVGPQPGPVSVGVGAGWWIGGKRPKREAKWPDLPKPPATPPWRLKVVQPRDARLRIAAQERNWKTKMRRARREEDMIVLSIIAALLSEGDDET